VPGYREGERDSPKSLETLIRDHRARAGMIGTGTGSASFRVPLVGTDVVQKLDNRLADIVKTGANDGGRDDSRHVAEGQNAPGGSLPVLRQPLRVRKIGFVTGVREPNNLAHFFPARV